MDKRKFVINDHVICEDMCNMSCDYCLAQDSKMKETHNFTRKEDGTIYSLNGKRMSYEDDNPIKKQMDETLEIVEKYTDVPILKVSGGEVLLIKGFSEYLKKHSPRYERVQLLTNGTLVNDEFVSKISPIPNIQVQLSLDSHSMEGNFYRIKSEGLHNKVLMGLDSLIKNGITVEISCVLTDKSASELYNFASYLMRYEGKVLLNPYPIRGEYAKDYFPDYESSLNIKRLIDEYSTFQNILPPLPYLERLYSFLQTRVKDFRCVVSRFLLGSFNDGFISTCPLGWQTLGNIYKDSNQELFDSIAKEGICKILVGRKPIIKYCKECFSTYDIFSLYVNGDVDINDIKKIPLFNGNRIENAIKEIKMEL